MKLLTVMILTLLIAQCEIPTPPKPPPTVDKIYKEKDGKPTEGPLTSDAPCSTGMWAFTYGPMKRFGDKPAPGTSGYPYVRETMHHRCVVVRGKVMTEPRPEPDGDMKFYLAIDPLTFVSLTLGQPPYYAKNELLNDFNKLSPDKPPERWLTVELVCAARPQLRPSGLGLNGAAGTIEPYPHPNEMSPVTDYFCEECYTACKNYKLNIGHMPQWGETIDVTGELITDTGAAGKPPEPGHGSKEIHPVTLIKKVPLPYP